MANEVMKSRLVIGITFLVALIFQTIPWPGMMDLFRPTWLLLVLCYWVLALPHRVSVGSALVLGVIWDVLIGSTLGIRGMMLSIVIYMVAMNFLVIRNLALWQQSLLIILFSVMLELLIFMGEYLVHDVVFNPLSLWSALINGILWPWLFLLLRRVRRHWHVR